MIVCTVSSYLTLVRFAGIRQHPLRIPKRLKNNVHFMSNIQFNTHKSKQSAKNCKKKKKFKHAVPTPGKMNMRRDFERT